MLIKYITWKASCISCKKIRHLNESSQTMCMYLWEWFMYIMTTIVWSESNQLMIFWWLFIEINLYDESLIFTIMHGWISSLGNLSIDIRLKGIFINISQNYIWVKVYWPCKFIWNVWLRNSYWCWYFQNLPGLCIIFIYLSTFADSW